VVPKAFATAKAFASLTLLEVTVAGLGIAYRAKPVLHDATDLESALYFMGLDSPCPGAL
jgi:hypothetical protein